MADPPANDASTPVSWQGMAGLAAGVAAISSAAIAIRLAAPLHPLLIAAGRVTISALALAVLAPGPTRAMLRACRKDPQLAWRILGAGVLLGLHFGTWIASLSATTVVRSVGLVSTQPLFAAFFGRVLGDAVPRAVYVGTAAAIAGTVVMTTAADPPSGEVTAHWTGDALALAGGAFAAAYLALGRSVRDRVQLSGYLVLVNAAAAASLWLAVLAVSPLTGGTWNDAMSGGAFWAVLYLGLVPGLVGHGMLNWAVRRMPVHTVSITILLEPVGAAVLATVILGEWPVATELVGGMLLLVGVAVGLLWRR